MELWELLEIPAGVTAVIGGGGKTSLLRALGRELSRQHRVVLCTTTKIYPFPDLPCARTAAELNALAGEPLICTGTDAPGGKLTVPPVSLTELARIYDYVLVEADGSAGRPMKAHAAHEDFALVVGKSVLPARRATLPFYTKGTARAKLQ